MFGAFLKKEEQKLLSIEDKLLQALSGSNTAISIFLQVIDDLTKANEELEKIKEECTNVVTQHAEAHSKATKSQEVNAKIMESMKGLVQVIGGTDDGKRN